jgi:hypothetical protein
LAGCEVGGWVVSQWVMMTGVAAVLGVAFWVDADCSMFRCYGVFVCRVNCFHLVFVIVGCIAVVFSRESFCASE